jgi:hypothetical protein
MRETRPSGSVEGVMSNHDPYCDFEIEFCAPECELAHGPRLPPK